MSNAGSRHGRLARPRRPLVLLAIGEVELRARFAYELTASGFDVIGTDMAATRGWISQNRPDIVIAALSTDGGIGRSTMQTIGSDPLLHDVPVVALAANAGPATIDLARREGCAAVCLASCPPGMLTLGLRTVLDEVEGSC